MTYSSRLTDRAAEPAVVHPSRQLGCRPHNDPQCESAGRTGRRKPESDRPNFRPRRPDESVRGILDVIASHRESRRSRPRAGQHGNPIRAQGPRVKNVTVTRVEVSPDLRSAKVYVSVMGDEKMQKLTLRGLESARGFLQAKLAERVQIRYTPVLHFQLDQGIKRSIEASRLLREVLPPTESDDTEDDLADVTGDELVDDQNPIGDPSPAQIAHDEPINPPSPARAVRGGPGPKSAARGRPALVFPPVSE